MKLFSKKPSNGAAKEATRLREILKNVPIFADLNNRELASVERILHKREYQPQEIIFREDEPGMGMYIIESGQVSILAESGQLQLSEISAGDFFGEVALLDNSPRSATAVAKTYCKIFGFFQPDLFGLMERDSRLGVRIVLKVAGLIGERLRKANKQILTLNEELKKKKALDK
jgi:CRP/FNR family cyclic AMP-dependent transcriptional regulator